MVFTGIVQAMGTIQWDADRPRLRVRSVGFFRDVILGGSVAVNGCCLTAVELTPDECAFDVMEETRRIVKFPGPEVNLELPMKFGDPLGGHVVTGHVDTHAVITKIEVREDKSTDVWMRLPDESRFKSLIVHKGCVTLNGTSLTVASLEENNTLLRVSLIPHTLAVTVFGKAKVGGEVNVEFDQALKQSAGDVKSASRPMNDESWMRLALQESLKGKYTAPPNPWVGCVIVRHGYEAIGCGYHVKPGTAHAEVVAIQNAEGAGKSVEGATAYVTLEPCCHTGRTGPCVDLLIQKKIAKVFVAVLDPDVRVAGNGIQKLRENGIVVEVGCCQDEVVKSLTPYLHQRKTGRPYVVCKAAMSLDGAIACADGTSQWITGELARKDVHRLRAECQAILVGSGTSRTDKPQLTVRNVPHFNGEQPTRVLLDSTLQSYNASSPLFDTKVAKTIVYTTSRGESNTAVLEELKGKGVDCVVCPGDQPDVTFVLSDLGKRGILQVLVEGGGIVQSSFFKAKCVDHLVVYYGNTVLGGGAKRWLSLPWVPTISEAPRLKLVSTETFGNDVCLQYSIL